MDLTEASAIWTNSKLTLLKSSLKCKKTFYFTKWLARLLSVLIFKTKEK